jgi:hypothetical protein
LIEVNTRIKMVIIIVLKPNSMIDTREDLTYGLKGSTWVDWVNIRTKSNYYYILKTQLDGRLGAMPGSQVGRVNFG